MQAGVTATGLTNATALGYNAQVTTSNSLVLGGIGANAVNVGIGTTAPASTLEVNGFTMLGSNAPAIKMLKFTGTTSALQGGAANIAHGLSPAKILSVSVEVEHFPGNWLKHGFTNLPGYEFNVSYNTSINVINVNGNSAFILGKPLKILIIYEQ